MKTRILSILIVASFFISTEIIAQPNKVQKQGGPEFDRNEMMKKRGDRKMGEFRNFFTEEQKEQMKELRLETAQKIKPLKNELGELMAHQRSLTTADNSDLKAINKNIDKMAEIKTEIAKIMAAQHQQVRSLLSEEQLVKFDSRKGKRGPRHSMNGWNRGNPERGA